MISTRLGLAVVSLLSLAGTACIEPLGSEEPKERTGIVFVRNVAQDTATKVAIAGAFYHADDLRVASFTNDTCVVSTYTRYQQGILPLQTLDAGLDMTVSHARSLTTVQRRIVSSVFVYADFLSTMLPPIDGDTFTVSVPGVNGSFPAATVRLRAAERIKTISVGQVAGELVATWQAPTVPGSRMEFSFFFTSSAGQPIPDAQVRCNVADDGSFTLSATLSAFWLAASQNGWSASRNRVGELVVDDVTRMYVLSSDTYPLPAAADSIAPAAGLP